MTEVRDEQTVNRLVQYFKGDRDAVSFALMVIDIADVWDDLVDRDRDVSEGDINRAMVIALSGIPRNSFYRRHQDELLPLMESGIFGWMAANELVKRGGQKEMEIANVLRHSAADLFVHMARLIGGIAWAAMVAPDIHLMAQEDTLSEFVKE